ncbi:MAG: diphosphatase [Frankiales bacterium]|jgi:NAD+ diphosphatase|nr:diphosphatase [Frankiales bacterium]
MGPPALSRFGVDRSAHLRVDEAWRTHTPMNVLIIDEQARALVDETDAVPRLVFVDPADATPEFFLGVDSDDAAYSAAVVPLPRRIGTRPLGLREVGALLNDRDAGLLTHAVALANWHATHVRCPRCGAETEPALGGHVRRCVADGSEHFPRTDPAVIMLVHDGGDRCVLGRQPIWPPGMYSTLAGFVEPGEAAEVAVAREVLEEVGLHVTDVHFEASQPWPFPASLMLGFTARAIDDDITIDGSELDEARWFTRDELHRYVARGEVLPPPVSIAWRLITDWLAYG